MRDARSVAMMPASSQAAPAVLGGIAYLIAVVVLLAIGYAPRTTLAVVLASFISVLTLIGIVAAFRWGAVLAHEQGIARSTVQRLHGMTTSSEAISYVQSLPPSWCRTYLATATSDDRSVPLDQRTGASPPLVRYLAGAVMLIGLLGTFLGLIDAVAGYESVLRATAKEGATPPSLADVSTILAGLNRAFATTTFGIISSLTLSALHVVYRGRERVLATAVKDFAATEPLLRTLDENPIARIIANTVNQLMPAVIREATERLVAAATATERAAGSHGRAAERFEQSARELATTINSLEVERTRFTSAASEVAAATTRLRDWQKEAHATLTTLVAVAETLAKQLAAHDATNTSQLQDIQSRLAQARTSLAEDVRAVHGGLTSVRTDVARALNDLQVIIVDLRGKPTRSVPRTFVERLRDFFR